MSEQKVLTLSVSPSGDLSLNPKSYLGPKWKEFRRFCDKARLTYDSFSKTNLFPVDKLPSVVELFRQEFVLAPDNVPKLVESVKARARELQDLDASTAELLEGLGLYPHQETGVAFLRSRRKALLWDDMGLGKTVQALAALDPGKRVLVVCPNVVKGNWAREAERWAPGYSVRVVKGRKNFSLPEPGELVVANYEVLPAPGSPNCGKEEYLLDYLVVDEAHYLKNHKTKRSKAFLALRHASHHAWGLTGTPLLNDPTEVWGILRAFGLATEAFGSWSSFLRLFNGTKGAFGGYEFGEPKPEAHEALSRVALRRKKADVLRDLPPKRYATTEVDVVSTPLADDLWEELRGRPEESVLEDWHSIETLSSARRELAYAKLPAAVSLASQYEEAETPVVFFSHHREPVEALGARPGWEVLHGGVSSEKRTEIVERFQRGELLGLAATIGAAGVGITLTQAADVVFVDRAYTPALNLQAEDRVSRIGQTKPVLVRDLVADHPLDELVDNLLRRKQALVDASVGKMVPKTETNDSLVSELFYVANKLEEYAQEAQEALDAEEAKKKSRFRAPRDHVERWAGAALVKLADLDPDRAGERNDQGFNARDTEFGHSLARCYQANGGLSDKQWPHAVRIAKGYPRQVGGPNND